MVPSEVAHTVAAAKFAQMAYRFAVNTKVALNSGGQLLKVGDEVETLDLVDPH